MSRLERQRERNQMFEAMYLAGASPYEIGKTVGMDRNGVLYALRKQGVKLRSHRDAVKLALGRRHYKAKPSAPEYAKEMFALLNQGLSYRQTSIRLGIPHSTVASRVNRWRA